MQWRPALFAVRITCVFPTFAFIKICQNYKFFYKFCCQVKIMEVYLAKHINKSAGDEDLSSALLMGDLDAFKQRLHILAKEDGDWIYNIPSDKNMLHEACEHGNLDIVKFLIENGADINLKDSWVYTPLLYAVYHDHLTVARYLIDKGAITTYRTLDGHRYSEWATDRDLIKLLEQHENK